MPGKVNLFGRGEKARLSIRFGIIVKHLFIMSYIACIKKYFRCVFCVIFHRECRHVLRGYMCDELSGMLCFLCGKIMTFSADVVHVCWLRNAFTDASF